MTLFKRITSVITAAVISFTALCGSFPASASASEQETTFVANDDVKISGTNSFGTMVANKFAEVNEKQLENNGYNVFSIEMEDNTAVVSYEAAEECSLVVAVYDDAGETMLGSGEVKVNPEEKATFVEIEIAAMPEYFSLKAFMVDPNTLRPKCEAFTSPMYTKAMQEFLSKTTDDFEQDRVLNLDEDKTKNFAVFNENVKIIHSSDTVNTPKVGTPDASGITAYTFTNCDAELSDVAEGDVFAVIYGEEVIIAKAVSVQSDDTSAVILGQDAEIENAFEHININAKADSEDAVVDDSTLDEHLEYVGVEYVESKEESAGAVSTYGEDSGIVTKLSHKIKFKKPNENNDGDGIIDAGIGLSGGLDICMEAKATLYFDIFDVSYIELSLGYEVKLYVEVEAKVGLKIPLLQCSFSPIPGVTIELVPEFIVEISAKISLNGTITGSVGFRADTENGITNKSKAPKVDIKVETEIEGFIGFALVPRIKLLEAAVTAGVEARMGAKIKPADHDRTSDVKHMCETCIEAYITPEYQVSFKASFLKIKWLTFEKKFSYELKPSIDFYWSLTYGDFGFSACPHVQCETTVFVVDGDQKPISGVKLYIDDKNAEYATDAEGRSSFMLQNGKHTLAVKADGYKLYTLDLTVANKAAAHTINLLSKEGASSEPPVIIEPGWDFDGETEKPGIEEPETEEPETEEPGTEEPNLPQVELGIGHSAVITENGDLYTWGFNANGELGNGTTEDNSIPIKIMSNVKSASLGNGNSAAITENGDLYTWGNNSNGELGNGTTEDSSIPTKIMSNVKAVSLGAYHSAAITENGDLYTWGRTGEKLGSGTYSHSHFAGQNCIFS